MCSSLKLYFPKSLHRADFDFMWDPAQHKNKKWVLQLGILEELIG